MRAPAAAPVLVPGVGRAAGQLEVEFILEELHRLTEDGAHRADDALVEGERGEGGAEVGDGLELADDLLHARFVVLGQVVDLPLDAARIALRVRGTKLEEPVRLRAQLD